MASEKKSSSSSAKSQEEIIAGFQQLRNEQRAMANKLSEMEMELNEHKIVIDTLKGIDPKKKCYRMIGGILCERTVGDVLPTLVSNRDRLEQLIKSLNEQVTKKGVEINEYKEKHNIRIQGQYDPQEQEEESTETKRNTIVVNPIEA